jgi:hypothetical protein
MEPVWQFGGVCPCQGIPGAGTPRLQAVSQYSRPVPKKKRVERIFERIKSVRGLSLDEKWLFATTLAATPNERWRMHESFLRSHGLYTRSERRKYGFK